MTNEVTRESKRRWNLFAEDYAKRTSKFGDLHKEGFCALHIELYKYLRNGALGTNGCSCRFVHTNHTDPLCRVRHSDLVHGSLI